MNARFLVLGLACCLLGLSACRPSDRSPDGRVQITFASGGNLLEVQTLTELVAQFEMENPDLDVRYIPITGSYDTVLLTMIAGGKAPDLFNVQPWTLGDMISKGVLMELEEPLAQTSIRVEDFFPQTLEPYRWDGKRYGRGPLYGLCKDWSPDFMVYYNQDHFDQAGLPYPDGTWTREQFLRVAQRLTQRDSSGRVTRFGVYNNGSPEQWGAQSGGRVFSEDGKRCLIDQPEFLEGVRFANDLSNRWRVAPGYAEQQQGAADALFRSGRVSMCFYGQWMSPTFAKEIKNFRWSVTTPPRHKAEVYLSNGMVGYGVYARTNRPNEAMRLLEFLVGEEGQKRMAKLAWNIPSNRRVAQSPEFLGNPITPPEVTRLFVRASEKTRLFSRSPYIPAKEFDFIFWAEWEQMTLRRKSPERAMQDAARRINQAIDDNMKLMGGGS